MRESMGDIEESEEKIPNIIGGGNSLSILQLAIGAMANANCAVEAN
jgi:hypothetical protein